jgi:hypothetical protein
MMSVIPDSMKDKVRYVATDDLRYVFLHKDGNARDKDSYIDVYSRHTEFSYRQEIFMDILGKYEPYKLFHVRVYFPDGDVVIGYVPEDRVTIYGMHNLFDGRFNAI